MTKLLIVLLTAAAALALAGCGDDDDGGRSKTLSLEAAESGTRVELKAPEEVEAGVVRIELRNNGKSDHDAQLIRVEGEHTLAEATEVLTSTGEGRRIPDWFRAAGGLGTTKPGQTRTSRQVLTPGKYIAFDTEREGEEGPDNYTRGGVAEFEVTGEASGELPPSVGPAIRADDYSFDTFSLRSGRSEVVFQNIGREPHHVVAAPLAEGATIEDVERAFQEEEGGGPPPFDEAASESTAVIDGGDKQIVQMDLKPGRYVLLCFISDRRGGPPHVAKGMIAESLVR